jgi:tRNA (guanosine-2'-O-)-methyltransferase
MVFRTIRALARSRRAQRVLTNALALCVLGCGGAQKANPRDVPQLARAPVAQGKSFSDLKLNADARPVAFECEYGAYETCNAMDDDCNGVIDDDCGYETGDVQITASWNSGADIDLYVTDPSGSTLFYNEQHKHSPAGGTLDHEARGDCRREQRNPRIENAYWSPAKAGKYKVELHYFSPCGSGATTEVTLSVVVAGETLGSYRYRLDPEQRIEALSFSKL